ncbi:MAG: 2-C-methyl-D-erythritol 2,4-cyclodiphosphate synthase [Planctomycetota bacterium]|jgi:2-C-methyl-D-erythritol 2,4-cyclodiphosphate synthase
MTGSAAAFPFRVGVGYDFHRFGDSGQIVLGGHTIAGCPRLEGHSDADVLIHAAMDAVLGAAGEVDIGTLFPDTDDAYQGARSAELADQVTRILDEDGFEIVNLDAVLVCDQPMISHHRPKIRSGLAEAFGIDTSQVNLKGKSKEGQEGRGHGVEATVVALLKKKDK